MQRFLLRLIAGIQKLNPRPASTRQKQRTRLQIETLEERWLLSTASLPVHPLMMEAHAAATVKIRQTQPALTVNTTNTQAKGIGTLVQPDRVQQQPTALTKVPSTPVTMVLANHSATTAQVTMPQPLAAADTKQALHPAVQAANQTVSPQSLSSHDLLTHGLQSTANIASVIHTSAGYADSQTSCISGVVGGFTLGGMVVGGVIGGGATLGAGAAGGAGLGAAAGAGLGGVVGAVFCKDDPPPICTPPTPPTPPKETPATPYDEGTDAGVPVVEEPQNQQPQNQEDGKNSCEPEDANSSSICNDSNQGKPDNGESTPNPDDDSGNSQDPHGPHDPAGYPKPEGPTGGNAGLVAGMHRAIPSLTVAPISSSSLTTAHG